MRSSVNAIRNQIGALRLALLAPSPEGIEQCLPSLADAVARVGGIERELRLHPNPDPALGWELKALQRDLRAVGKLVANGLAFWNGWGRLLGSASAGYTPSGEPQPVSASGSISLRG
jgi:hypothetical protein